MNETPNSDQNFSFDDAYRGVPPWDIGRPQRELIRVASSGELKGKILDSGCGTGENSLYFASLGFEVVGADFSKRAIEKARTKASKRKISGSVTFVVSDALNPAEELLQEAPFDTVVDSGLYHAFEANETDRYIQNIARLLRNDGSYFVLCFSERQEGDWGPRRIPKSEIEQKFSRGWTINYIREVRFENNDPKLFGGPEGARAWLASITKKSDRLS